MPGSFATARQHAGISDEPAARALGASSLWCSSLVDDTEPPPSDTTRRALRHLASGVTVLTVNHSGLAHGATVSAVVPLSRKPPAIGACLRTLSAFTEMALTERYFSVNVLGAEQAPLATRFAIPSRPPGDAQFAGIDWTADRLTGAPLLRGCVANLSCRVSDCIPVGDHDLIIAEVIAGSAGVGGSLVTYTGRLAHAVIIPAP